MEPIYRLYKIVEVVCIVKDAAKPSYRVKGVVQREGDRCRMPLADAEPLVSCGKARLVDGSESRVVL